MSEVTKLIEKIHDQVVHLNYDRAMSSEQKLSYWDAQRVKDHIDRTIRIFESHITEEAKRYWEPRHPQIINVPDIQPSTYNYSVAVGTAMQTSIPGPTGPSRTSSDGESK